MTKVIAECTTTVMSYRERIGAGLFIVLVALMAYYGLLIQKTVFAIAKAESLTSSNHSTMSELQDIEAKLFKIRAGADLPMAYSRGLEEPASTLYITRKPLGQVTASVHEL